MIGRAVGLMATAPPAGLTRALIARGRDWPAGT